MSELDHNLVSATWRGRLQPPQTVPDQADVVVIGGGIVGVSTAWFLAKQGISVVLCEKGHIAGEQSGRNWGWVRVQGRDVREIPMMLDSLEIWSGLADEIGEDVGFHRGGCLFTADRPKDLSEFECWQRIARDFGIGTELLDQKQMASLIPGARANWCGGLYTETDGRAEPHKAAPAIARAARRAGATVLTCCAVRGVETSGGRVSAVVTEHGRIATSTVVCAAGAWTSIFCRSLGIALPQLWVHGTVARTGPAPQIVDGNIFDHRLGIRRRQDGGYTVAHGSVLEHPLTPASFRWFRKFVPALLRDLGLIKIDVGREFVEQWRMPTSWSPDETSPFERRRVLDPQPTPRVLRRIRRNLDTLFPSLAGTPIVESWGGMIEASPDVVPVIDEAEALPGFYIASGFSGHGFGIGPGAGKAIARYVTGRDTGLDMDEFRLSRFFDGTPVDCTSGI